MGCRHVVHQPADAILCCMAVNKWLVLVRHDATLAKREPCLGLLSPKWFGAFVGWVIVKCCSQQHRTARVMRSLMDPLLCECSLSALHLHEASIFQMSNNPVKEWFRSPSAAQMA